MAVLVIAAGLPVRRFLRGEAPSLNPVRAARTLVLAQAAALTGAGASGWYAAQAPPRRSPTCSGSARPGELVAVG